MTVSVSQVKTSTKKIQREGLNDMNVQFQNLIDEISGATTRHVGIIDGSGAVVASSDVTFVGHVFSGIADEYYGTDNRDLMLHGYYFRLPDVREPGSDFDYAAFCEGSDEEARKASVFTAICIKESRSYNAEKYNRSLFLKNLMNDNTLLSEVYTRSKELRLNQTARRVVFLIRQLERPDVLCADIIRTLHPDTQHDFVIPMNDEEVVLIKEIDREADVTSLDYETMAAEILDALTTEVYVTARIGIGSEAETIRELSDRYKEAYAALEIGPIFEEHRSIFRYNALGLGRIIYQLPNTLCDMFINEVFQKNPIEALDAETLQTIDFFFANNLNVSETSRKLFVHRNTLVYRLEKIKKITGLDLREFDHAIVFKVALMIRKYMHEHSR